MNAFPQMLVLATVATLLTACGSEPVIPFVDFVTYVDNGETVTIQNGGTIHLDLVSINDDRRTWYIAGDIPKNLLQVKEPNYRAFKEDYINGRTTIWEFKMIELGTGVLNFAYRGDSEDDVTKQFSITIDVHEPRTVFTLKGIEKERARVRKQELKEKEKIEATEKKQAMKLAKAEEQTKAEAADSSIDATVSKKRTRRHFK